MSKVFHKNLELWAHFYPKEAVMLPYLEEEGYRVEKDKLIGPKGIYEMGDPSSWFANLPLKDERVLVVYGVGLGELYTPVKKWLKKEGKRRVFFFEEDPHVLARFFERSIASEMLVHPQVEIHWMKELSEKDPALDKFFWSCAGEKAVVGISPPYERWYPARSEEFAHHILFALDMKNALIHEYVNYGTMFFRSFYFNMLDLPDSYLGNKLFGKFKGVPAIICGAGPSLEKQLPLLKTLKDKAFLVAGGSSLNVLSHGGLLPHFSCGLDPNVEQAVRLRTNNAQGVPFFYRNRMHVDAFRLITGPRLYITGSGGYDVSDYYEKKLGIEEEFIDEGHNVINFLCEITTRMGCNPIIFVGLDLAFTGLKIYSKGVIDENQFTESTLPPLAILKKTISGQPIWTEWKWVEEAAWIRDFAKDHPKNTFINSTEGGLGLEGIEHMPLKEAAQRYLTKAHRLDARLKKAIEGAKDPKITHAKMRKLTRELYKSLQRCLEKLTLIEKDTAFRIEHDPLALTSGKAALAETELLQEPGYTYVLDIFNTAYAHLQNQPLRRLRLTQEERNEAEIEREKLVLQNERIGSLKIVVQVNLELIDLALKEKKNSVTDLPYMKNISLS